MFFGLFYRLLSLFLQSSNIYKVSQNYSQILDPDEGYFRNVSCALNSVCSYL
jgi:hypothetical protein